MFNSQMPDLADLPTSRQLVRSTLLAAAAAGAILIAVVWPAEFGVDPTGIGRTLGLTQMGEIKALLAREADADAAAPAPAAGTASASRSAPPSTAEPTTVAAAEAPPAVAARQDRMSVTLAPGQGAEIKVKAAKGIPINYDWSVSVGRVNYDTHADAPGISYHGYGKGQQSAGERGILIAAFDGSHGWFWRNRSAVPVTVTLHTNGGYSAIRRVV